nr:hypothetical transcript [Hymenolepis microstoma]
MVSTNWVSIFYLPLQRCNKPRLGYEIGSKEGEVKTVKLGHLLCLDHGNIVRLKEVFEIESYIYMVSEFIEGKQLFQYFAGLSELSEILMSNTIKQINCGLLYLHNLKIAHRNLKPNNIIVQQFGNAIIMKISDSAYSTVVGMDMEVELVNGCITYTAPEIFLTHKHGIPVDMWALGVILFILVSGKEPFARSKLQDSIRAILNEDFTFDGPEWEGISFLCKDLIRRLLSVDPVLRMTAVQTAKHKWIIGEETPKHILPEIPYRLEYFNTQCNEQAEYWRSKTYIGPDTRQDEPLVETFKCICLKKCENESGDGLYKPCFNSICDY